MRIRNTHTLFIVFCLGLLLASFGNAASASAAESPSGMQNTNGMVSGAAPTPAQLEALENAIVDKINEIRTNPQSIIQVIQDRQKGNPENDCVNTVGNAVTTAKNLKAMTKLIKAAGLRNAALVMANDQKAMTSAMGIAAEPGDKSAAHVGSDGSTLGSRAYPFGEGLSAESISPSGDTAIDVALGLFIDFNNEPDCGHRKMMIDPKNTHLGVGCVYNIDTQATGCVLEYGQNWKDVSELPKLTKGAKMIVCNTQPPTSDSCLYVTVDKINNENVAGKVPTFQVAYKQDTGSSGDLTVQKRSDFLTLEAAKKLAIRPKNWRTEVALPTLTDFKVNGPCVIFATIDGGKTYNYYLGTVLNDPKAGVSCKYGKFVGSPAQPGLQGVLTVEKAKELEIQPIDPTKPPVSVGTGQTVPATDLCAAVAAEAKKQGLSKIKEACNSLNARVNKYSDYPPTGALTGAAGDTWVLILVSQTNPIAEAAIIDASSNEAYASSPAEAGKVVSLTYQLPSTPAEYLLSFKNVSKADTKVYWALYQK